MKLSLYLIVFGRPLILLPENADRLTCSIILKRWNLKTEAHSLAERSVSVWISWEEVVLILRRKAGSEWAQRWRTCTQTYVSYCEVDRHHHNEGTVAASHCCAKYFCHRNIEDATISPKKPKQSFCSCWISDALKEVHLLMKATTKWRFFFLCRNSNCPCHASFVELEAYRRPRAPGQSSPAALRAWNQRNGKASGSRAEDWKTPIQKLNSPLRGAGQKNSNPGGSHALCGYLTQVIIHISIHYSHSPASFYTPSNLKLRLIHNVMNLKLSERFHLFNPVPVFCFSDWVT